MFMGGRELDNPVGMSIGMSKSCALVRSREWFIEFMDEFGVFSFPFNSRELPNREGMGS